MNNEEAKFILGAYRPDGRDATDPQFGEALAQAERDPELRRWLESQRAFDRAVSERLGAVTPPPGLRESILAGSRVSQPRRTWWANPAWWAAAAAVVVLAIVGSRMARAPDGDTLAGFANFAADDIVDQHDRHDGFPAGLGDVQARLAAMKEPLSRGLRLDLEELRRQRCRSVRVAGREVFELCFNRDGTWYHLYVASRGGMPAGLNEGKPLTAARGEYASVAWLDDRNVYALVARTDAAALQRLI
jgi:anti-sigma factor RsiW